MHGEQGERRKVVTPVYCNCRPLVPSIAQRLLSWRINKATGISCTFILNRVICLVNGVVACAGIRIHSLTSDEDIGLENGDRTCGTTLPWTVWDDWRDRYGSIPKATSPTYPRLCSGHCSLCRSVVVCRSRLAQIANPVLFVFRIVESVPQATRPRTDPKLWSGRCSLCRSVVVAQIVSQRLTPSCTCSSSWMSDAGVLIRQLAVSHHLDLVLDLHYRCRLDLVLAEW